MDHCIKFFLVSFLLSLVKGNSTNPIYDIKSPVVQLGAVVTLQGEVDFIAGTFFITVDIKADRFLKTQLNSTYHNALEILHILKSGGIAFSNAQLTTVESEIKELSYNFASILKFLPNSFIDQTFWFKNLDDFEEMWRYLVFESLRKITIFRLENTVVPQLESRVVHYANVSVFHPKFKKQTKLPMKKTTTGTN